MHVLLSETVSEKVSSVYGVSKDNGENTVSQYRFPFIHNSWESGRSFLIKEAKPTGIIRFPIALPVKKWYYLHSLYKKKSRL
jgi:hypothetical protein